jgi:hypothetical protein
LESLRTESPGVHGASLRVRGLQARFNRLAAAVALSKIAPGDSMRNQIAFMLGERCRSACRSAYPPKGSGVFVGFRVDLET